jgi:hypothetical protein
MNFCFHRCKDAADFGLRSFQIVDGTDPQSHRWDLQFGAPREHVVELLSAEIVGRARVDESMLTRIPPITVQNNPDVTRGRARMDLAP